MADLQRFNPSGIADQDTLRRSPTARAYAQGLRERDAEIARLAREKQAEYDREMAAAAAEDPDQVVDLSTPEAQAKAIAEGLV